MSQPITHLPRHVAIIPDGNRRWAKARGLKPWEGHEAGARVTEDIIRRAADLGIYSLSLWGSSLDNLAKRPFLEVQALFKIYREYFAKLADNAELHEREARINFIGRWEEQLPGPIKKVIHRCIDATKGYSKHMLNFFLAYNGDEEMLSAIRQLASEGHKPEDITPALIKQHLMTRDLPPVDLLVRTGGEPHLSAGFMMWDVADSQLYFTDKNFPDFDGDEFEKAIMDFDQRGRRYGS